MKQKPCRLCDLRRKVVVERNRLIIGDSVAKIEDGELLISYDAGYGWVGMKAKYCPLCGKKIELGERYE